jgi:hypothetical protein
VLGHSLVFVARDSLRVRRALNQRAVRITSPLYEGNFWAHFLRRARPVWPVRLAPGSYAVGGVAGAAGELEAAEDGAAGSAGDWPPAAAVTSAAISA